MRTKSPTLRNATIATSSALLLTACGNNDAKGNNYAKHDETHQLRTNANVFKVTYGGLQKGIGLTTADTQSAAIHAIRPIQSNPTMPYHPVIPLLEGAAMPPLLLAVLFGVVKILQKRDNESYSKSLQNRNSKKE
jgi:hypothetical protein